MDNLGTARVSRLNPDGFGVDARVSPGARLAADRAGVFVFFDLETTGLSPRGDRIIEIAALKVAAGGRICDRFHCLVHTDHRIPLHITTLTGITAAMLRNQEDIDRVLPRFLAFAGALPLVAYNAAFEMDFLRFAAERLGLSVPNVSICLLELARNRLPDLPSYRLAALAQQFGVRVVRQRRALSDCELGLEVFTAIMRT